MMQDQFDTTGETAHERAGELPVEQTDMQPQDTLTTRDIVSAGRRANLEPTPRQDFREDAQQGTRQADAASAPRYLSGDATDGLGTDAGASGAAPDEWAEDAEGSRAAGVGPEADGVATHAAERQGQGVAASPAQLLSSEAMGAYQARWDAVQTAFVDDPRRVVEQADSLVAEVMQRLAETFAQERAHLERQWDQGGDVSTENLRLALQRYRSFFQRLLST